MGKLTEQEQRKFRFKTVVLPFLIGLCLYVLPSAYSLTFDSRIEDEINIVKGDLENIAVFDLTRISITKPQVADLVNVDTNNILVLAKQSGETNLFVWDKYGKRSIVIRVFDEDLDVVKARLEGLFASQA